VGRLRLVNEGQHRYDGLAADAFHQGPMRLFSLWIELPNMIVIQGRIAPIRANIVGPDST
jgi:hypothetical protein